MEEKPPIGVRPQKVWLIERAEALAEAINKRVFCTSFYAGDEYIIAWCEELAEIAKIIKAGGLTQRALDVCPAVTDGAHSWREDITGKYCFVCGKRQ